MIARFHWLHARVFWKWWNHMEVVHHLINYYILIHIPMEWEKWSSTVVIQKYGPNLSWEPGFWSVLVLYLENNLPGLQGLGWDFQPSEGLSCPPPRSSRPARSLASIAFGELAAPKPPTSYEPKKNRGSTAGVWRGKTHQQKNFEKNGFDIVCLFVFFFLVLCLGEQSRK